MPKKENLLQKLCRKPIPKNFTKSELDILMDVKNILVAGVQVLLIFIMKQKEFCSLMNRIQEKSYIFIK